MSQLQCVGEDIWSLEGPTIRFHGVPYATRAVLVRLPSGGLWFLSPPKLTEEDAQAVKALGPVEHLVEPNKIHSIGLASWHAQWPEAQVWVSPGFPSRHPGIAVDHVLGEATVPWSEVIDHHLFAGHAILDEVVFLHRPSKTLLVTDLIQKHDPARDSPLFRVLKWFGGALGPRGGMPRDIRASFTDRQAARDSRARILSWNFDQLIVAHGLCVPTGAKAEVSRVLACLG